jgi:hypothetical protein
VEDGLESIFEECAIETYLQTVLNSNSGSKVMVDLVKQLI